MCWRCDQQTPPKRKCEGVPEDSPDVQVTKTRPAPCPAVAFLLPEDGDVVRFPGAAETVSAELRR